MRLDLAVRAAPVVLGLVVLGPVAPAGRAGPGPGWARRARWSWAGWSWAWRTQWSWRASWAWWPRRSWPWWPRWTWWVLAVLGLVARVDLDRMARVVPAALAVLAVLDRVGPVDLTDRTALVGPVVQDRMGLAAPAGLEVQGDLEARMARVAPAGLNTAAPVVPMARVVLGDLGTWWSRGTRWA